MKNLLIAAISIVACLSTTAQTVHHLSPSGNDKANGTSQDPVYSLNRALELVRNAPAQDTAYVKIAKGRYFMDAPLEISAKDQRPIVFEAEPGAEFVGGMKITGWQEWKNGIWRAYVPEVAKYGFSFEQLWVNDARATNARTPNKDWYYVQSSCETPIDTTATISKFAVQQIDVAPEELAELSRMTPEEIQKVKVLFYHKWDITQKYLDHAQADDGRMFVSGQGMKPWNRVTKDSRYVLSNYLGALDVPGEWFLSAQGWLYYMPEKGVDMNAAEVFAPVLEQFVVISGEKNRPVKDKVFKGLTFKYSSFKMPDKGNDPMQAAAHTPAAVVVDLAENIQLLNCTIQHTGAYAVWIRRESKNNRIDHCLISDLGAGGIKIGETEIREGADLTRNNVVNNNIIQHAGSVFPCGVGVAIFHSSDNRVTHNEISDLRYSGVSVGWVWGYKESGFNTMLIDSTGRKSAKFVHLESPAVRNVVEYNNIHHIGWGELSDMGAVYTLGESPGTRINNNVIHDILSYDYGGWGLYTDEGSTGVVMENNLAYRCKSGGFHQHYGRENIIRNNIFAFGHHYQVKFTRVEPHKSIIFTNNIIVRDRGVTLAGPWLKANMEMDYNCYFDVTGAPMTFNEDMPLGKWRKHKDVHSIVADPLFRDLANDDYTLRSTKVVKRIDFKPFDYKQAGVYGSEEWISRARLSDDLVADFEAVSKLRTKQ